MSLLEKQLEAGLLWSKLPQFHRRIKQAEACIREMLSRFPDSYVSNSWGKQSVVMSHLVWMVDGRIRNVHWTGDDAEIMANFGAVRDAFLSEFRVPYVEMKRETRLREAVAAYERETNPQGYFVGLCAYEAKGREKTIENARGQILAFPNRAARCTPLGWWTQDDLAAYIAVFKLPLLDTYHRFGLEARTSTGARFGSFTERALDLLPSSRSAALRQNMEKKL